MKNKLTKLLKFGVLFLAILLYLTSCEKQNDIIDEIEQPLSSDYNVENQIYYQFKDNIKLTDKIKSIEDKIKNNKTNKSNNIGKGIYSNSQFNINLNEGVFVTNKKTGYHSYTFALEKNDISYNIYNLVLSLDKEGNYLPYLMTYYLTKEEQLLINNGNQISFEGKQSIEPLSIDQINLMSKDTSADGCWQYEEIEVNCTCHTDEDHEKAACGHPTKAIVANYIPRCGNTGGGGIGGSNNSTVTGPSGPSYPSNEQPVVTTPINPDGTSAVPDILTNHLSLSPAQTDLLIKMPDLANDIFEFLQENNSLEAKTYAKGQIELETLHDNNKIKLKPRNGKINNRDDQKYTHFGTDGVYSFYKMEDGSTVISCPSQLTLNSEGQLVSKFTSETSNEYYWYIKPEGSTDWSNYLIKDNYTNLSHELEITAKLGLLELGKAIGTYVLPIEDVKILITGTDFDGEQMSRLQTAGFMIVGIVPGGKLLKPLSKGTGKVWKVVIKKGDKVFTRTVRELTEETIHHFDNYAEGARDLLQEALRKGDILDDEIIIEVGQEIADLSSKKGRKLTWPEVQALFKRGNDFNFKGRLKYGDEPSEIVLADGKRLDTYIDGQKILSRKATDIDNITESTWRNYCNELVTKYKAGKLTNSSKLKSQVNLSGKYYLEIPASNQNASKLQRFRDIAAEYGKDNQSEGIIITFLTE